MYKKFIFLLYSTCCCNASLRIVNPVHLGGDKDYKSSNEKKTSNNAKKEKLNTKLHVMSQTPENNSTAFNSKNIIVTFNRKIVLDTDKILVSGGVKDLFSFATSGNKLIIGHRHLKQNTTYQINCTNAIRDFDQGYCDNIIISFSTGEELNKGCIKGKVFDLMTNNPAKGCLVALYKPSDKQDNIINSEAPLYFTITNDNGEYCFDHLANDSYFLCAGHCEKGRLRCDAQKNKYGFHKDYINVADNETQVDVDILKNDMGNFQLVKTIIEKERCVLVFNQTIKKVNSLTTYIKSLNIINALKSYSISEDQCNIIFHHSSFPMMLHNIDKLPCHISICNNFDTVLDCDFELAFSDKWGYDEKEKYQLRIEHQDKFLTADALINFKIIANKEIEHVSDDRIILYFKDHLGYRYIIDKKAYTLSLQDDKHSIHVKSIHRILDIIKIITGKEDMDNFILGDITLELVIKENAIILTSRENTRTMTFNFKYIKNFGCMSGNVNVGNRHAKIQLLDSNCQIIDTITDNPRFVFKNIPEGKYKLRVFVWPQEQHAWSCGNINYKKPHDPVIFYQNDIDIMNHSDIKNIDISYIN